MRCYICDNVLGEDDVRFNRDHQDFDPCPTCKEIIREAANELQDEEVELTIEEAEAYVDGAYSFDPEDVDPDELYG